jgi:hypothetical protein
MVNALMMLMFLHPFEGQSLEPTIDTLVLNVKFTTIQNLTILQANGRDQDICRSPGRYLAQVVDMNAHVHGG